ncbi:hypothetical protein EYY98_19495 [Obesumbacterium proteus]|nr:hypothetical protein EYY98_19495 [Obesumbacterium proteus]
MRKIISPRGMKITSWGIIFIQVLTPLLISASSVARATEYNNMEETILGLQSVVDNNAKTIIQPTSPLITKEKKNLPALTTTPEFQSLFPPETTPTPSAPASITPEQPLSNLPSLGSDAASRDSAPTADLTGNAMQAGQILSSDNVTNASINYAKSIGEGLINQQINDWLNQKGTARVSVGSDNKIAGDMLLPIIGNNDSLFFSQVGLHGNEDRNTANLGLGYRQYIGDWMYGVNTFYDYDYTGKNARFGVGGEAWTDYLKLAVNGYYGLTDWHQSHLSDMKDYDERPANGFDLRAEAYLPSYPQLGANIKYEQYFGKGIDLGTGTNPDDLKNNPKALTLGLNYTPVPLVTIKGEHSVGDKDDSRIGLDINYRFGVPWAQQISADSVDALRSLMGSMYEFVDRNYEIVMQYRKQDLLRISLPSKVTAKAAETIILPLTVSKAKYGLKDVDWTASAEFLANGGSFRKLSLTQLEVKLPPYVYTKRANAAQAYVIKAVGVDNNGNNSNTAATTINVEPSKNIISELAITPSGSVPANDSDYFTVTAFVRDEQSQPMVAEPITFDIANLKGADGRSAATLFKDGRSSPQSLTVNTDGNGKATVFVRSKLAKIGVITATMNNGNYKSGQVEFIADAASAQISALDIIKNNALADGQSTNKLQATVKDANGNALANVQVGLDATHNASLVNGSTMMTDSEGQAMVLVTNAIVGDSTITARINGSAKTQAVTFVADKSTSVIRQGDMTATQDAIANGTATNKITAKITDANANAVSDVTVHFSVSNGAKITTVKGVTGDDGIATATVTSLKADTYTVTARIQESGNSAQADTRFIADSSTATITDSNLTIDPNGALANGVNTDNVTVIVTDANNNLVPNATVNFAVASGATITTVIGNTGTDGKATATVTSSTSGNYAVTATVNGHSASKDAVFVADSGTATITSGDLKVTIDNALANGTAMNAVQAKVTDAHGNTVPNVTVNFTADHGAIVTTASAVTDASGLASTTLSNTTSGTTNIIAAINGTNQNVNTNFAPDDSTATITKGNLVVIQNNAKANGSDANSVQAKVTDANGNLVPNATVNFSANHGATIVTASATTNAQGLASTELTNTLSGTATVTAKINAQSIAVDTQFVADGSTAVIVKGDLTVTADNAKADGHATNAVQAKVTDANGNLVPNASVSFSADNGATIATATATTNAQGLATTSLTNLTTGIAKVTATINSSSQVVNTHFVADDGTATIVSGNLTVLVNNAKANGADTNSVQAKVTDANGNLVPNTVVSFTANHGATVITASATTNENGLATTTLTNVSAGVTNVSAAINGNSQNIDTTFVADDSTSTIVKGDLTVIINNAKANGTDSNKVQAKVTDANGNLVPNTPVSFTANNGATVVTALVTTDSQGLASTSLTNITAGITKVTATVNANSQVVDTTFTADDSTATIVSGDLTIIINNAKANGTDTNKVQAKVTDANGNLVPNTAVSFVADNGATVGSASAMTDSQGLASTTLTNVKAGITTVTATINGDSQNVATTFVADDSTSTITSSNLTVTVNNAKADGVDINTVQAKVTDAKGNSVPNATVRFTANNGASIETSSVTTDDQGLASTNLTNITAGITKVTAAINGTSQTVDTSFEADGGTSTITDGNLTVTLNNAKADGSATNAVQAKVTDANGNAVPNADVNFSANNGATVITATVTTNAQGLASTTLTNVTAGTTKVTAAINGNRQSVNTTFIPDDGTSTITDGNLTVTVNNAKANGSSTNEVQAKVTDANGNTVPNVEVRFSANNGASIIDAAVMTNENGVAVTTLTNVTAGNTKVTAVINGANKTVDTTFVADDTTGTIVSGNLTVTADNAKANGTATNTVQVKVTDANGNLVPNTVVNFTATNGATVTTASATTNTQGLASTTLTNVKAGVTKVTATINGDSQTVDTTFIADDATGTIVSGALTVIVNNAKANGTDSNKVQATVTDANGNLVPNTVVTFTADNGATVTTASATTDAQGLASTTLTNVTAGITKVTAAINSNSQTVDTTFVADDSTGTIVTGDLTVTVNNAKANGSDTNAVQAKVTDANGNVVPDTAVTFAANNGATVTTVSVTTDTQGLASTTLTNVKAGITKVTATINGNSQDVDTTFVADDSTSTIVDGALTITVDNAKANGTDTNKVLATVTDANGNRVPNTTVSFSADNGAAITTATVTTDDQGLAATTLTNVKAGITKVTAAINGNSQTVDTTFVADDSTGTIVSGNLTITVNNAKADGTETNAVQAKVTDANGNLVPNTTVSFTANNGATVTTASATTDGQGLASTTLTNVKSGITKVTASINGNNQSVDTTFVADDTTSTIVSGDLTVTINNAKANGTDSNKVQAKVTDANGNRVPNATVSFVADNGATVITASVTTDDQGLASTTLTNIKAGITKVTATVNGNSQTADTTFVADDSTATIVDGDLTVIINNAKANSTDSNKVQAKVTDANGNLVPNTAVSFAADNGATVITASVTTDSQGLASTTLTNIKAGVTKVTATINGNNQTVDTTFVADDSTSTIVSGDLTVTVDNAKADGTDTNKVQAKVTDANGNLVPNVNVSFTADNGATVTTAAVSTDAQGLATTTLTNITAGITKVTAAINGHNQTVDTTFVADITTAAVTTVTLDDSVTDKIANGTDFFTYTAIVKDAHGNLVPNATVNWSQDKGNTVTLQAASSSTDVNGKAAMVLTSTSAEALLVQVSASLTNGTPVDANKKVNFKQQLVKLHGVTKNAINNAMIPNTKIELSLTENNANPEYSVTSGTDGKYEISIPQGVYYVKASATGFITLDSTLDIQTVTDQQKDFVLSPNLDGKAARIVLTWNDTPADLDSYLWVPKVGNPTTLIKVNYGAKSPAGADATLDVDARSGYGPETITVDAMHPGEYCYVVNRFSGSPAAYGGAKVKLYLSDGSSQEFKIEDATGSTTDMANWTVFKIDTTSGQTNVNVVNKVASSSDKGACQ